MLVQGEGLGRGRSNRLYQKRMGVGEWDREGRKNIRWEKEVRKLGVEGVWKKWDKKILDGGWRERGTVIDIKFARIVLQEGNRKMKRSMDKAEAEWWS